MEIELLTQKNKEILNELKILDLAKNTQEDEIQRILEINKNLENENKTLKLQNKNPKLWKEEKSLLQMKINEQNEEMAQKAKVIKDFYKERKIIQNDRSRLEELNDQI